MITPKKLLARLVHDLAEEVRDVMRDDPLGDLTLVEAVKLLDDPDSTTVAEAERLFRVAKMVMEADTLPTKPEPKAQSKVPPAFASDPDIVQITDPDEIAALAKQYGVPEDQVIAYKRKGRTYPTANGPVREEDIPRDKDGNVDPQWLEENCGCEEHKAKRAAKKEQTTQRAKAGTGGYL